MRSPLIYATLSLFPDFTNPVNFLKNKLQQRCVNIVNFLQFSSELVILFASIARERK